MVWKKSADHREDVVLVDHFVLFVVNLDFGAAVTAGQDDVADLDVEGDLVAQI